jgi:hypothetical protein
MPYFLHRKSCYALAKQEIIAKKNHAINAGEFHIIERFARSFFLNFHQLIFTLFPSACRTPTTATTPPTDKKFDIQKFT